MSIEDDDCRPWRGTFVVPHKHRVLFERKVEVVTGEPISREEALRRSRETLERAERERAEEAVREAGVGYEEESPVALGVPAAGAAGE